jgi:signal transduction histidine kinase
VVGVGAVRLAHHSAGGRTLRQAARVGGRAFWAIVPLVLVAVTLLGSVALPARVSWRITRLLRESTEVLAPARLLEAQLQLGLAKELAALQRYAISGDDGQLGEYRAAAAEDERRLAALERLTARLDVASAGQVAALRARIGDWRRATDAPTLPRRSRAGVAAALEAGQPRYDAALDTFLELSSTFAAIAATRDDRVRALEQLGLASNAVLVLAALVAMGGVAILTVRERRLAATLQRRVEEAGRRAQHELALREAAESLAGAYTVDEVTRRIAEAALEVVDGSGALVERVASRAGDPPDVAVVQAVAGTGLPAVATTYPLAGSCTELVSAGGQPVLIPDLAAPDARPEPLCRLRGTSGSAIVVSLGGVDTPMGALSVVSAEKDHFHADDVERAGIFGHLARLAYEKVRLLEEAHEGRRVLEHVIASRSRLIRGFSHDVKNPIGAADGYAELLTLGAYGELTAEQRASVERLRRCLRGALSLIRELHELGRAETGNVAVTSEPLDVAELVRAIGEEYHAAVRAGGLALAVDVDPDVPVVDTDRGRVRQIVSNLLSNAIKYTERGSIRVRAYHQPPASPREAGGWACIAVIDTGLGIPSDKRAVIFEEFSRLGADGGDGAGLGLAISKLLAQALGGRISVESELGRGSTFTLWLPLPSPEATD